MGKLDCGWFCQFITREDDPEGSVLDNTVTERARGGVLWVRVGWVRHNVDVAAPATNGLVAEPNCAVG